MWRRYGSMPEFYNLAHQDPMQGREAYPLRPGFFIVFWLRKRNIRIDSLLQNTSNRSCICIRRPMTTHFYLWLQISSMLSIRVAKQVVVTHRSAFSLRHCSSSTKDVRRTFLFLVKKRQRSSFGQSNGIVFSRWNDQISLFDFRWNEFFTFERRICRRTSNLAGPLFSRDRFHFQYRSSSDRRWFDRLLFVIDEFQWKNFGKNRKKSFGKAKHFCFLFGSNDECFIFSIRQKRKCDG